MAVAPANRTHRHGYGPLCRGATLASAEWGCTETNRAGGVGWAADLTGAIDPVSCEEPVIEPEIRVGIAEIVLLVCFRICTRV